MSEGKDSQNSGGWVKIHRKIINSPLYRSLNSKQRDVMIQCLLMANFKENEWEWHKKIFKCQPGQFITSLESLKEKCARDVTIKNIRTALIKLEKWKFLTNESAKTGRLITICKWEEYQLDENETGKQIGKQVANKWQTSGKQVATNEECKECKECKESKERRGKKPKFTPPSLQQIKEFFSENGYSEQSAIKAFNYYDVADWHQKNGEAVKNWKQQMISVWFKDENRNKQSMSEIIARQTVK
ncbi:MAG: hypothetical protein JXB19_01785 [Bacteroidales bacterium]|nr:hypothetical protein [Bacteroidales bacterium]